MPQIRAIVFDLYGTLLELGDRALYREVPRLLGIAKRRWMEVVRSRLLTTSYPDREAFAGAVCAALQPDHDRRQVSGVVAAVETELASIRPFPGVLSLLRFLKGRGLGLGLLSNLSSVHTEPLRSLELDSCFDVVVLSCAEGRTKPDPEIYRAICRRLGVVPEQILSVGDSHRSDVVAPSGLGMRALRVAGPDAEPSPGRLRRATDVGLLALSGTEPLARLLAPGHAVQIGRVRHAVCDILPLPDAGQGRYNLVYEVATTHFPESGGAEVTGRLIAKRYLAPESAHVEELAYHLQGLVGLPTCAAQVIDGPEPILVAVPARGAPFAGDVDPDVAYQIGRHTVFAYVLSNADMRPRNAFLDRSGATPAITMVDLEHCFLNLAIDVSALPDPLDPHVIDSHEPASLHAMVKRRVLTDRTLRRARHAYFPLAGTPPAVVDAYRQGVLDGYRMFKTAADDILDLIANRMYREPYLIVGTRAYRRAMARIDLEDIAGRLDEDPGRVADVLCEPDEVFRARSRR